MQVFPATPTTGERPRARAVAPVQYLWPCRVLPITIKGRGTRFPIYLPSQKDAHRGRSLPREDFLSEVSIFPSDNRFLPGERLLYPSEGAQDCSNMHSIGLCPDPIDNRWIRDCDFGDLEDVLSSLINSITRVDKRLKLF